MKQTLIDNFWGLHKNMNCAFLLNSPFSKDILILHNIKSSFHRNHVGSYGDIPVSG